MKSLNQKLFILFGVQLLIVALVWWPRHSKTHVPRNLFGDMKWEELTSLTVQDNQAQVSLKKIDFKWVVPEQFDYPADEKKIAGILKKLEGIKPGMAVGQTASSHRRLEVGDEKFQRKISFEKANGEKAGGLYLGSSPQFRQVHIRRVGEKEVYATDQLAAHDFSVRAADWVEKKIFDVKSENIIAIEVKRGKEILSFKRGDSQDKDGKTSSAWMLDGKAVNKSKFDGALRNLADLHLSEVLGKEPRPEYGLEAPAARVKLTFKADGSEQPVEKQLSVGKKLEQDFFARLEGSPYYLKVPGFQVSSLLETKKKDFW